jgi:hypothetical protein
MMLEDLGLHSRDDDIPKRRYKQQLLEADFMPEHGSLRSLDLDAQLYTTYAKAKNYLAEIQNLEDTPANQVAQVFNTISGILKEIVKMQTDLYSAERVKKLEAAMIQAIKLAPREAQEEFFREYEKILTS